MEKLLFGSTGLRVSRFAFGTGRIEPAEAPAAFARYADAGGTFFDTASAYQNGESEELLGAFLAGRKREDFVVATKYGRVIPGSHRKAMRTEIEASLRRLRTDYVDFYMPHFDDGNTPIEEIERGLEDLIRAGKVLYSALSNFPAWRAASLPGLSAIQLEYSLIEREPEREHLPLASARRLGVMSYSPLAAGRLAKVTTGPLADIAKELGTTPSAVSLAWVSRVVPVLGPRTLAQLEDTLAGAELRLDEAHRARLDAGYPAPSGGLASLLPPVRAHYGLV